MLTKKVKMYAGYLHILGMVHDCKWISRSLQLAIPCVLNENAPIYRGQWMVFSARHCKTYQQTLKV